MNQDVIDKLITEIDEHYSRNIEALVELQARYRRDGNDIEVVRLGGKIEGYKEMRDRAIEAIRLLANALHNDPQWIRDALRSQLVEAAGDMVATLPAHREWTPEELRLKASWWECVR